MSASTIEIKLSPDALERFNRGHEACGVHDNVQGLVSMAATVGLACLEKIDFDVNDAVLSAARRPYRKGGGK